MLVTVRRGQAGVQSFTDWVPNLPMVRDTTQGQMRAAGIDLGTVRVGLAVADELGLMAHPRPALSGANRPGLLRALARFAKEEQITLFVVGLPSNLNGREGPPARRARVFAAELHALTGIAVELLDERLTTRQAQRHLHEQGLDTRQSRVRIDSAAAAVLLQGWLDSRRPADELA
ncbi:MAG: Holliday junction resolvase RuvX [Polyangiaceae bacterium]|nr:Holliday junction resolvase RuvX [Polyangiaceae bacterium]